MACLGPFWVSSGFNDCCWFFGQSSTIGFQADGMFIMEGDEVVAVNGTVCEGQDLEKVSKLVKESEGPSLRSKSFRCQVAPW